MAVTMREHETPGEAYLRGFAELMRKCAAIPHADPADEDVTFEQLDPPCYVRIGGDEPLLVQRETETDEDGTQRRFLHLRHDNGRIERYGPVGDDETFRWGGLF